MEREMLNVGIASDDVLATAIVKEESALWFGTAWVPQQSEILRNTNWVGIWCDATAAECSQVFGRSNELLKSNRVFEVLTGALEDHLRVDFAFSRSCPFFYLSGCTEGNEKLSKRQRLVRRDSFVDQLARPESLTLVVEGVKDTRELDQILNEDLEDRTGNLRQMVLTGTKHVEGILEWLEDHAPPHLLQAGGIHVYEDALTIVLDRIARKRTEVAESEDRVNSIRVGPGLADAKRKLLSLRELVTTTPPIDDYFDILKTSDLRPPEPGENKRNLLIELLSNRRRPWRAFKNMLHWDDRSALKPAKEALQSAITSVSKGSYSIECVDILAEPGSGLSTLLSQLAMYCADNGYPVLVTKAGIQLDDLTYRTIKSFVLKLEQQYQGKLPIVIIADHEAVNAVNNLFRELPKQLDCPAVLIRGSHLKLPDSLTPLLLKSTLGAMDFNSLCRWIQRVYEELGESALQTQARIERLQAAQTEVASIGVPYLLALHYLLEGELREATGLGPRMLEQISVALREGEIPTGVQAGVRVNCSDGTSQVLILGEPKQVPGIELQDAAQAVVLTAALATLNEPLPVAVFKSVLDKPTLDIAELGRILAGTGIMVGGRDERVSSRAMTQARSCLRLTHYLYGEVILGALARADSAINTPFKSNVICCEVLEQYESPTRTPIDLLKPVFSRLRPGRHHDLDFAESIALDHLRPSRYFDNEESSFQNFPEGILEAFSWMPFSMIESSGPLLHSRALCRLSIPFMNPKLGISEKRNHFVGAASDLEKAIMLERRRYVGEDVANLKTTLGRVFKNWALRVELFDANGDKSHFRKAVSAAQDALRDAVDLGGNNYPVHSLADLLITLVEWQLGVGRFVVPEGRQNWLPELSDAEIAEWLDESLRLLTREPDADFSEKWQDTKRRAIALLNDEKGKAVIQGLKSDNEELGYALDAVRILGKQGIPEYPTNEPTELSHINDAINLMEESAKRGAETCGLGDVLRYALYSAKNFDDFRGRFELVKKLRYGLGRPFLAHPVWRFDLAMLAFQMDDFALADEQFIELRRKRRFLRVPKVRSISWFKMHSDTSQVRPRNVQLRITKIDPEGDQLWGQLVSDEFHYSQAIPLTVSNFTKPSASQRYREQDFYVGNAIHCQIMLRPAGPFAVPIEPFRG